MPGDEGIVFVLSSEAVFAVPVSTSEGVGLNISVLVQRSLTSFCQSV